MNEVMGDPYAEKKAENKVLEDPSGFPATLAVSVRLALRDQQSERSGVEQVPTGRVKWYDAAKGYGFVTSDEGGDVFLPKGALPAGVTELKGGQRIEFGVVDSRRGAQALGVKLLDTPPSVAELRRRPAEELHGLIEDMIKVLEAKVQPDLRRGRFPDKRTAQKIAQLVHAVARELEV